MSGFVSTLNGLEPVYDYGVGTSGGATATLAATAGVTYFVTGIYGFGDGDSALTIKDGSTAIAEWAIDVSIDGGNFSYTGLWLPITPAAAATGVLTASSANCAITIQAARLSYAA